MARIAVPGGGMLLVPPSHGAVMQFSSMAHKMWRLRKCLSPPELATRLARSYGCDPALILRDILAMETLWNGTSHEVSVTAVPEQNHVSAASEFSDLNLNIEGTAISLTAPDIIVARLRELWLNHVSLQSATCMKCEVKPRNAANGDLLVDSHPVIENAPWHELMGGFHHVLLRHFNPETRFASIIHAASVSLNNQAVILAAPSGSGKSTLTAQLAAGGYRYLSDDIVALSADKLHVAAFPTALSVKPGSAQVLAQHYPHELDRHASAVQYLAFDTSFKSLNTPAKLLVFPRYKTGAELTFTAVSIEDALARLLSDRIFFGYPLQVENIRQFVG
jgi:hypothetical protein